MKRGSYYYKDKSRAAKRQCGNQPRVNSQKMEHSSRKETSGGSGTKQEVKIEKISHRGLTPKDWSSVLMPGVRDKSLELRRLARTRENTLVMGELGSQAGWSNVQGLWKSNVEAQFLKDQ